MNQPAPTTCEAAAVILGRHDGAVYPVACDVAELCDDCRDDHQSWCTDCKQVIRETEERPDLYDREPREVA